MSEHTEQASTVRWFEWQYPKYKKCLIAIPNGSHFAGDKIQRIKQINKLKKEGFKNGVSDLLLAVPKGQYHGLWIEMKDIGKKEKSVSTDQMDHIDLMNKMGYYATWCAGFESATKVIDRYMKENL